MLKKTRNFFFETEILMTKIYNTINQSETFFED